MSATVRLLRPQQQQPSGAAETPRAEAALPAPREATTGLVAYLRGLIDDFESRRFPDWAAAHFQLHTENEVVFLCKLKAHLSEVSWGKP